MNNVVADALKALRSQGIRIPRTFSKRLENKSGYSLSRNDMKQLRERLSDLGDGKKLVVYVKKQKLKVLPYETYTSWIKTAKNAMNHVSKEA